MLHPAKLIALEGGLLLMGTLATRLEIDWRALAQNVHLARGGAQQSRDGPGEPRISL